MRPFRSSRFAALAATALLAACGGDSTTEPPPPPPPAVQVSVTPSTTTVNAGATASFTATVVNSTNTGLTWTTSGGTIAPSGTSATWTAPGVGGSYTVTATSAADPSKSASASVTVTPVGLVITPATSTIGAGDTVSLTVAVTSSANTDVTWRASAGSIIGNGATVQFAAPVSGGSYTVTATSVLDTARRATAAVTVTPVTVGVTSVASALFRGASTGLTATVGGTSDPRVTWNASCGAISGTGASVQYTAPEASGDCIVTARSVRDTAARGVDTVTVRRAWRVAALDDVDDGACTFAHCSLREAIAAANASPDVDSILLLPDAQATGTITLTASLPFLSTPMHLVGPGSAALTINANASTGTQRGVLYFNGDLSGSVRGMTLRGGVRAGGGGVVLDNAAQVTLRDVHVRDNTSVGASGGGLLALRGGRGTLVDVELVGNRTTGTGGAGGGVSVEPGSMVSMVRGRIADNEVAASFGGGARVFNGALMLDSVLVAGNRALTTQGGLGLGGAIFSDGADAVLQLVNSTIDGNRAGVGGGGLAIRGGTTATITGSSIEDNQAPAAAGVEVGNASATLLDTDVRTNTATQRGGGVFVFGTGTYTHTRGSIASNTGGTGGGGGVYLQQDAAIALTDVAVDDNTVTGDNGGGIWGNGNATISMTRGSLSRNTGANVGGGLFISLARTVTLIDVVIEANEAREGGGGLFLTASGVVSGGAVRSAGLVQGGRIARNRTTVGGGGGVFAQNVALAFDSVTFDENTSAQGGGALLALGSGTYEFTDVTAEDNTANTGGALGFNGTMSIDITRGVLQRNRSNTVGGGLWKAGLSTLTMTGTQVLDNTAGTQGGGIQLVGPGGAATLTAVTVRGNTATGASGGGLTAGVPVMVTGSTFANNTTGAIGGGIFAGGSGNAVVRNSTFSGNTALMGGGVAATGPASLTNVTLVANRATDYGGGIGTNNAGAITVTNVLLVGNLVGTTAGNCGTGGASTITSAGGNLSDDAACVAFTQGTDKPNTPAGVNLTLANNGGLTFTHALLEGSAAINAAVGAACPATDQRGFSRVGGCDIGAFEFGGTAPAGARASTGAAASVRRR
jgi:CSLREA domain-containing protein